MIIQCEWWMCLRCHIVVQVYLSRLSIMLSRLTCLICSSRRAGLSQFHSPFYQNTHKHKHKHNRNNVMKNEERRGEERRVFHHIISCKLEIMNFFLQAKVLDRGEVVQSAVHIREQEDQSATRVAEARSIFVITESFDDCEIGILRTSSSSP